MNPDTRTSALRLLQLIGEGDTGACVLAAWPHQAVIDANTTVCSLVTRPS